VVGHQLQDGCAGGASSLLQPCDGLTDHFAARLEIFIPKLWQF
jgi:hypothetical protein